MPKQAKVSDSFGFDSSTYDTTTSSTILPKSLRKKVHDALPKSWSTQWKYFYEGQISFCLYSAVFIYGVYVQFIKDESVQSYRIKLASTIFFPWSWAGIIGIAHEAGHSAIAPSRTFLGKIVNFVYKYTLLPLTISGVKTWNKQHNINHHKTVNQIVDLQTLRGNNCIEEAYYAFYAFLKHTYDDILEVFENKLDIMSLIQKLWTSMGIGVRLYLLFGAYNKRGAYIIGLNIYFLTFFINYFVFLSHAMPTRSKKKVSDYFILQLRETWEIFPQSRVSQFLHFGFGAHASHHTFGYLPRSLLPNVSKVLKENCKDEYKEINTISGELWLFWNRFQTM